MNNPTPHVSSIEYIDLKPTFLKVYKFKKIVLIYTAITIGLGLIHAFLLINEYRATAVLSPTEQIFGSGEGVALGKYQGLAAMAGFSIGSRQSRINEALATLNSFEFNKNFLAQNEASFLLKPGSENNRAISYINKMIVGDKELTEWKKYKRFIKNVGIEWNEKEGLLSVSVTSINRAQSILILEKYINYINSYLKNNDEKNINSRIKFIKNEISENNEMEIKKSLYELLEVQLQKKMLANTSEQYAFKVIQPAYSPDEKYSPRRSILVVIYTIFGVFLGVTHIIFIKRVD